MILPVCKPSITSYLHHANYLSIIEADSRARHYLINYFLQLYWGMGNEHNIDFYSCDGMYPRYPFIHCAWLSAQTLGALGDLVVDQACGMIDSGCFVEALLDEYCIRDKISFQRSHFPHQNLIYGYSKKDRLFFAQGFNKHSNFTNYTISFEEFKSALRDDLGVSVISRTNLVEYNNSQSYSPLIIKTYLSDFLESRCSFLNFRPVSSVFGAATYGVAIEHVKEYNEMAIDIRPWCVFHEHKLKLMNLYEYLCMEKGAIFTSDFVQELTLLESGFHGIKNYLLEAKLTSSTVKISSLRNNIGRITEMEQKVVSELIRALDFTEQ